MMDIPGMGIEVDIPSLYNMKIGYPAKGWMDEFKLKNLPGVYILIDKSGKTHPLLPSEIVYIGEGVDIRSRIEYHKSTKKFTKFLYLAPLNFWERRMVEAYYAILYKPKYNIGKNGNFYV